MNRTVLARVGAGENEVVLDLWLESHEQLLGYGRRIRDHIVHRRIADGLFAYFVVNEVGHGVFVMSWDDAQSTLALLEAECGYLGLQWNREAMHPELFEQLLQQGRMVLLANEAVAVMDMLGYITQLGHGDTGLN